MPGTTAGGTPYALPEDPLVQWPATSQSVAVAIDAKHVAAGFIQRGSAGPIPAGGATVTFPTPFKTGTQPVVVVSVVRDYLVNAFFASTRPDPTATSFVVDVFDATGQAVTDQAITYIAVGEYP